METTDAINEIKVALSELKTSGQKSVAIDALEKYLEELKNNAGMSIELRRLESQHTLAYYDAQTKHNIEMFKSVIESGREALNALVLVNGGAAVALLGFMGAIISKGLPQTLGLNLTLPILQFGLGVLMGALGYAARYFSQAFYASEKDNVGLAFTIVSIIFAIIGYTLFGFGIYGAFDAFSSEFHI